VNRLCFESHDIYWQGRRESDREDHDGRRDTPGIPQIRNPFDIYISAMVWRAEEAMREKDKKRGRSTRGEGGSQRGDTGFIPLSYIDEINSVRVGKEKPMDEVLEEPATRYRLYWNRT